MHDNELIKILRQDPNEGMRLLMRQYTGLVCAVVRGKFSPYGMLCEEDTEECVSDVFCEFYKNLDKFNSERGSVKTLLCTIAAHKSLDLARNRAAKVQPLSIEDEEMFLQFADDFLVDEELVTAELRERLMQEINALGEPDREIIVRKFFFCEPSKSIAERLSLTATNVDTRTHRALKKLREKLEG